ARLAANGKPPMVILCAMMRKLVHVAVGVLKAKCLIQPSMGLDTNNSICISNLKGQALGLPFALTALPVQTNFPDQRPEDRIKEYNTYSSSEQLNRVIHN
ncbi:hypothetical protein VU08_06570, partial [Desulfobulbus sp. F5]|nr:hypothetical protein [Desulfobulbus sp. F5]